MKSWNQLQVNVNCNDKHGIKEIIRKLELNLKINLATFIIAIIFSVLIIINLALNFQAINQSVYTPSTSYDAPITTDTTNVLVDLPRTPAKSYDAVVDKVIVLNTVLSVLVFLAIISLGVLRFVSGVFTFQIVSEFSNLETKFKEDHLLYHLRKWLTWYFFLDSWWGLFTLRWSKRYLKLQELQTSVNQCEIVITDNTETNDQIPQGEK